MCSAVCDPAVTTRRPLTDITESKCLGTDDVDELKSSSLLSSSNVTISSEMVAVVAVVVIVAVVVEPFSSRVDSVVDGS